MYVFVQYFNLLGISCREQGLSYLPSTSLSIAHDAKRDEDLKILRQVQHSWEQHFLSKYFFLDIRLNEPCLSIILLKLSHVTQYY